MPPVSLEQLGRVLDQDLELEQNTATRKALGLPPEPDDE